MPLRIARPKKPETEFRRKRSPPPQATKLLLYSLAAGLVFMGALAVVFVPRYLSNLNQPAVEILFLNAQAGGRLVVGETAFSLGLANFNATLYRDDVPFARLGPGLKESNASLQFTDANGNGLMDQGDFFTVIGSEPGHSYRLEVRQVDVGRLVGSYAWTGAWTPPA